MAGRRDPGGGTDAGARVTTETTDEQLMLAFQRGDASAFEALVRRHRQPVFAFLLRSTGNAARAEDLLQETWLKVLRGSRDYQPKARFKTWLYTLARNLCVDSARKESHRRTEPLDAPVHGASGRSPGETVADGGAQPERGAFNRGVRPLLEQALASLPTEQREVFVLREFSGVTFKEIAEVTGVPENTVKSRMRYALESLRRQLTALGVDGDLVEQERVVAS